MGQGSVPEKCLQVYPSIFPSLDGCTFGPSRGSRYFSRPAARFPLPLLSRHLMNFALLSLLPPPPLPALFMVVALLT
jgi:hypothetical protein